METTSLIAAFIAQRARLADVAGLKKPNARERNPLIDQPLNQTLEDNVRRSFFGKRERYLLQRVHVHSGESTRKIVVDTWNSLKQRDPVVRLGPPHSIKSLKIKHLLNARVVAAGLP
jgi:hypothetical protein